MSFGRPACVSALLLAACATAPSTVMPPPALRAPHDEERAHVTEFVRIEEEAIGWLAAADPRLAARLDATAPEEVLKRVGLEAVLAEDTAAQIRDGSLDLFAFRARARALEEAAKLVAGFRAPLPETGPLGTTLARPRLERELLERLIAEERRRADEEASLGQASGELVRGIVATWTPPKSPQDGLDRDVWVNKHLLEVRASLRDGRLLTGPSDLEVALYPLERLLAPMQFPRGSAGIAEVRIALDDDMRVVPKIDASEQLARAAKAHLGVSLDVTNLQSRLESVEGRLRELASRGLSAQGASQKEIEARARDLLLIERPCPTVPDARVRSMAPPPERAAICGALRALTDEGSSTATLVALHDDVLLSFAAIEASPPALSRLLSHPEDEDARALQRKARERPLLALGVALEAELLYGEDGAEARLRAWQALGEAPLDIVARELGVRGR